MVLLAAVLSLAAVPVTGQETSCGVKYISAEHIYLDAGLDQGLVVGAKVRVIRDEALVAELEVVYAARNSATCRVIGESGQVVVGDRVAFVPEAGMVVAPPTVEPPAPRTRTTAGTSAARASEAGVDVRGWMAVQWDQMNESDGDLQTSLMSLPFRVKVSNFGKQMVFRARGSLRRIDRQGFSGSIPDGEWRNRIQEVALVREGRDLDWHFALGRVGSRYTAAAGPFDGLSFNGRVAGGVRLGAFAGFTPEWENLGFGTEDKLAGLTFHLNHRSSGGNILDMVISGVGRYHQSQISREYLVMTTTWRVGRRLSLLQGAEVDVNRGWRKEAAGESMTLSGLALSGRYRLADGLDVNLGYDDRQPVRTWQSIALSDSLFIDAGRMGWRAGLNWRGWRRLNVSLYGSMREDSRHDQNSTSWNARLHVPEWPGPRWSTHVSYRAFDGPYLSGWAPAGGVSRAFDKGLRLRLDGGYYGYEGTVGTTTRSNSWAELGLVKDLGRRWSVAADYRRDWGDDIKGGRLFAEVGLRF